MRFVACAVSATLLVAACGGATGPTTVALEMDARLAGNTLHIEGTTDLPDGALLLYEAEHERLEHDPETPVDMLFTEGTIEVASGRFAEAVDLSLFDSGEVHVTVSFQMDLPGDRQQPFLVRTRYGSQGERLQGPNVSQTAAGASRVAVTRAVER